jgi:hypothetical protein
VKKTNVARPGLSYAEVEQIVQARANHGQAFGLDIAFRDFVNSEQIELISDEALARIASKYREDRIGYGQEVVAIIAGEKEKRAQAAAARNEDLATKALGWSRWGAVGAGIGALAAIVAAVAAVAVLFK